MLDAIIIGGGLAGSSAGIGLARQGWKVLILEKQKQSHKVCGEFLAPSVWPVLKKLGIAETVAALGGRPIGTACFSSGSGAKAETNLPFLDLDFPFGYGISRQALYACLLLEAKIAGCEIACPAEALRIEKNSGGFSVEFSKSGQAGKTLVQSRLVINAAGRKSLSAPVILRPKAEESTSKSPRRSFTAFRMTNERLRMTNGKIGFKAHFEGPSPDDQIRLFFFPGGYFGISAIENNGFNLCGIVNKKGLQKYHADFNAILKETSRKNSLFGQWFAKARRTTDWITCASLAHGKSPAGQDGVFYAGDSACFLEPFMGQGMTMALAGGLLLAETLGFPSPAPGEIPQLQACYQIKLGQLYQSRLSIGNLFHRFIMSGFQSSLLIRLLAFFPSLFQSGVKKSVELSLPAQKEPAHAV